MKEHKKVDLHIHSVYSDGTMRPEAILEEALDAGVEIISIADHNILEGAIELYHLAKANARTKDVKVILGVELDSLYEGRDVHILAYNFNLEDLSFRNFVKENRHHLDLTSEMLIERMTEALEMEGFTKEAYDAFEHINELGGWKALHFLKSHGLIADLMEGLKYYTLYDCGYDKVAFLPVSRVCEIIHAAGGIAILAHPGVTFKGEVLMPYLRAMLEQGIDGIECYYPKYDDETESICVQFCNQNNILITSGSDCHGSFGQTSIGESCAPISQLNLNKIKHVFEEDVSKI